jgi:hypothetical protein
VTADKKIYTRVLHRLLRETNLGKIPFSPDRMDGVPTDEPNTPEEEVLALGPVAASRVEWW